MYSRLKFYTSFMIGGFLAVVYTWKLALGRVNPSDCLAIYWNGPTPNVGLYFFSSSSR
jgi:hypothetical protein